MTEKHFPWKSKKTKCVILCAGKGSRLLPLSETTHKAMLKIAGKPILGHVIDYWRAYTDDFVFVVHYRKEDIIDYVGSLSIKAEFIELEELRELAYSLRSAARANLTDNFIVALGDCLNKGDFRFPDELDFGVGVWPTSEHYHIKRSYSVDFEGDIVRKLVEKPTEIINNICGMGSYFFNKKIFDYIDKTPPSALRNQIELTDAIQKAVEEGEKVKVVEFIGHYININDQEDLKRAEELFGGS